MSSHYFPDAVSARNYETFRDCLAPAILLRLTTPPAKPRRRQRRQRNKTTSALSSASGPASAPSSADTDPAQSATATSTPDTPSDDPSTATQDLSEFIDYIAHSTFTSLPESLQTLTYHIWTSSALEDKYPLPLTGQWIADNILPSLDPSVEASLSTYGITTATQTPQEFMAPVLTNYLSAMATAPPPPRSTKADAQGCEICGRDWINLSYHHLIPRMVHDKVVKRGWHGKEDLENVAWLCGACHRFVHSFAGHEELAREYYTVERLLAEEKVREWAAWVGRLRWKKR